MLPDPVNHHTRGQRVMGARNGISKLQPAAAMLEHGLITTQHRQKSLTNRARGFRRFLE